MRNQLRVLICVAVIVIPQIAMSTGKDLTLDEVIIRVLKNNPGLKSDAYSSRAAASRIEAAKQSQPYYINLAVENIAGSNSYKDTARMETTLSFSKVLEMGSKAEHRGEIAKSQYDVLINEKDMKRLDILAEATRRFIHVVVDQHRFEIIKDKVELIDRSYKIIARKVNAGQSSSAELRRISIEKAKTAVELEHAEHELISSRLKLAIMWGSTNVDFSFAKAALYTLETPVDFSQLESRLVYNPELVNLANKQRLRQAKLNLAMAKQSPDIELTAGVRQFKETNDNVFLFAAKIPFGLNSRARDNIQSNRLLSEASPYHSEQQKLELYESLFEVSQELVHAYEAVKVYREKIIPEAELALKDFEKGYFAGRYSYFEYKDAQATLLNARLQAVLSAANYHRFKIEIDRLTGAGLDKGVK